jgi:beta-galactosidase GanA
MEGKYTRTLNPYGRCTTWIIYKACTRKSKSISVWVTVVKCSDGNKKLDVGRRGDGGGVGG